MKYNQSDDTIFVTLKIKYKCGTDKKDKVRKIASNYTDLMPKFKLEGVFENDLIKKFKAVLSNLSLKNFFVTFLNKFQFFILFIQNFNLRTTMQCYNDDKLNKQPLEG